jgi:hypothetical protein
MAWYDDPAAIVAIVVVAIIVIVIVVYAMRKKSPPTPERKKPQQTADPFAEYSESPFKITKSIQTTVASSAKDELRILDLEREILGDAIRRLYEANAEGKITEAEREKLAASYKMRMNTIKDSIAKDENILALHELEGMQEDLMRLFSERFGDLTHKVDELRTKIDVRPIREIPIKLPTTPTPLMEELEEEAEEEETPKEASEEKVKKKRKPPEEKSETQKTEAEKRIESIRSEVEKVLDKLGQMEIEG